MEYLDKKQLCDKLKEMGESISKARDGQMTALVFDIVDELPDLFDNIINLLQPKCTCWKCMGLSEDPYRDDEESEEPKVEDTRTRQEKDMEKYNAKYKIGQRVFSKRGTLATIIGYGRSFWFNGNNMYECKSDFCDSDTIKEEDLFINYEDWKEQYDNTIRQDLDAHQKKIDEAREEIKRNQEAIVKLTKEWGITIKETELKFKQLKDETKNEQ